MGKDAVGEVELAIWAPGEAIEQFVTVLQAEACKDGLILVRLVVAVGVTEKEQIRSLPDKNAAVSAEDGGGEVQAVREDGAFVRFAVVIRVLQDDHAVARRVFFLGNHRAEFFIGGGLGIVVRFGCAAGVFIKLHDPKAAPVVPGHRYGIDDHGFAGKTADGVTIGNGHFGDGFLHRGAGTGGGGIDPVQFFGGKQSPHTEKGEAEGKKG